MKKILEVKNLICGYDSRFFLEDVNLKVDEKEFIGIIGPNGSGKTTLLRAITRVLKPKSGTISFNGRDLWSIGPGQLACKVAVVSQKSESANMSVEEYILLGRTPHYKRFQLLETQKDFDIAARCMALTETECLKNKLMDEISGGERQLALIARALTQEPELLLLDEPTTFLDITHQINILDLIKRLNRELNLTVMMVLHDLNLASEYCDRLVLLNKGRIHKMGRPEEVIDYRTIEEVYRTLVVIDKNPISLKPHLFTVTEDNRKKERDRKPDRQKK